MLNANDFFLNLSGHGKGVLNQNQYGGTFGGPIKKEKLFFFGSFQGTRQKNGVASQGNECNHAGADSSGGSFEYRCVPGGSGLAVLPL